jgi:hypothetical protein
MRQTSLCVIASLAVAVVGGVVAACVGDEPSVSPGGNDAGGNDAGGTDSGTGADVAQGQDSAPPGDSAVKDGGTDASGACGTPAKDCLGGACVSGQCQPVMLAAGQNHPNAIVLDGTTLYWVNVGNHIGGTAVCDGTSASGSVMSIPTTGGTATPIATNQTCPAALAVEPTALYWTSFGTTTSAGTIQRADRPGGTNQTSLYTGLQHPVALHVDGTDLYWVENDVNNLSNGAVRRAQVAGGGTVTTLAGGIYTNPALALDAANLYFFQGGPASPGIRQLPKSADGGVAPTSLTTDDPGAFKLVLDQGALFWLDDNPDGGVGGLESYTFASSAKKTVAPFNGPRAIAVDTQFIYYSAKNGTIYKIDPAGSSAPLPLYGNQTPNAIAVDAQAIYWTNFSTGEVMKLAK